MRHLAIESAVGAGCAPWRRHRFKSVAQRREVRVGERDVQMLSLASAGYLYPRGGKADRQQVSEGSRPRYLMARVDDLVVNPMWLTGGSVAVSTQEGAVSPDYRVFELSELVVPRFMHHLLRSEPYRRQYDLYVRANTTFDRRIQQIDLDNMPVWLPGVDEQRRIADFLDDRVSRIDHIVTARERQLSGLRSELSSRLQSVADRLSSAYGPVRLRYRLEGLEQGWSPQAESRPADLGEWGVMRSGCVNGGTFRAEDNKALPSDLEPRAEYELRGGDLLVSRASGSLDLIGSAAVVPSGVRSNLLLCDKIYRLRLVVGWRPEFVAAMLRTTFNRQQIRLGVSGAEGMANNLPSGLIKDLFIPDAPPGAQDEAIAEISRDVEVVGKIVDGVRRGIELLTEYKHSLVKAAVTGELDVTTARREVPV